MLKTPQTLLMSYSSNLLYVGGGIILNKADNVVDIIKRVGNSYIHKQVEIRNGLLFMRLKKRRIAA